MNALADHPWIASHVPTPGAAVRLLCFSHAGGSAAGFAPWRASLPQTIDVWPIEYPGRGSRRGDPPFVRLQPLVASLRAGTRDILSEPFAIFGECMGALVAFEFARRLYAIDRRAPVALFVAGCRGPRLPPRKPPVFAQTDDRLIAELRALRGTSEEILSHPDFARLFLPTLRADWELADTYAYRPAEPIGCPIVAYAGSEDLETPPEEAAGWATETSAPFQLRTYPGDHSFLRTSASRVLDDLADDLMRAVCVP